MNKLDFVSVLKKENIISDKEKVSRDIFIKELNYVDLKSLGVII